MSGATPAIVFNLLKSQFTYHPPPVISTFEGQTVIVTGGNAGLGKNAIQHLLGLKVEKVIMAVRTISKGEAARDELEKLTGRKGVIEVWPVNLASYSSVVGFAERAKTLDRLDAVIANAGVWPRGYTTAEGHETTITTNVIATMLMVYLLLPKLRQTALEKHTTTRISTVGSDLHKFATLKARKQSGSIFAALDAEKLDKSTYDMRYNDSKMLLEIATQELGYRQHEKYGDGVIVSVVNPGYCKSNIKPPTSFSERQTERIMARTTDEGGIALVDAIALDKVQGRNAQYINDGRVNKPSPWLSTEDGRKTSSRIWTELEQILDAIVPGLSQTV